MVYLAAGAALLISEIWKQLTLTMVMENGSYIWSFIPFQLCSLPMYLALITGCLSILGRGEKLITALKTFLADFGTMSGVIVLLDQTGMHYDYAPLTVHSYLWHAAITALGVYAGLELRNRRGMGSYVGAGCVYLLGCAAAEVINLTFDRYGVVNMFYINPHYYMEQIVFRNLRGVIPNNAVIALYILATLAGGFIVHLMWTAFDRAVFKNDSGK